jgi:hypothetical protein
MTWMMSTITTALTPSLRMQRLTQSSWCSAPSTSTTHRLRRSGSRRRASSKACVMTTAASCVTLAQTRLCSGLGLGCLGPASASGWSSWTMSSGARRCGATVYTAATWAMRRVAPFSPLLRRFLRLGRRFSAALRVAGRRSSCRIDTPLPSVVIARISPVPAFAATCLYS